MAGRWSQIQRASPPEGSSRSEAAGGRALGEGAAQQERVRSKNQIGFADIGLGSHSVSGRSGHHFMWREPSDS